MEIKLPVSFTGKVLHGKALGRTVGMPTANIVPEGSVSGLVYGVYRSEVLIDGQSFPGITNLGCRPTVATGRKVNIETYIFDFEGDLYEREITVTLTDFIRPEMQFSSFEELSDRMRADMEYVRNMIK